VTRSMMRFKRWLLAGVALPMLLAGLLPAPVIAAQSHHIVRGDTAYAIARHYGVELEALVRANSLADASHIQVGDTLTIPAPSGPVPLEESPSPLPAQTLAIPKTSGEAAAGRSAARRAGVQQSPTARLSVPVVLENQQFPPVVAEISTTELFGLSPRGLLQSLQAVLSEETAAALEAMGTDLRPPADLEPLGVRASLNTALLAVQIELTPAARSSTAMSVSDLMGDATGPVVLPERFAAGVTAAFLGRTAVNGPGEDTGAAFLNGFANVGGIDGVNLDFGAFYDVVQNDFRRDRIVLFRDDRQRLIRYSAGDLSPVVPRQAGAFDTLGIGVERRYETLQPRRNVRPAGRRSFVLDRPATVEIYVNGALINRFDAPAGALSLDDIPLTSLSNEVTVIVDDALGRRELDTFSLAADITLLAPGLTEFSLSGGLLRDFASDGSFEYSSDLAVGGSIQRGLSDTLTVGGHAAASQDLINAGASAAFGILRGVAAVEAAASNATDIGSGYSVAGTCPQRPAERQGGILLERFHDLQRRSGAAEAAVGPRRGL
jgi:outer membrane usher protein